MFVLQIMKNNSFVSAIIYVKPSFNWVGMSS